jgi:phosphoserine aminotransferase
VIAHPEHGLSILGLSHRSDWFEAVVGEVDQRLRRLLHLSSDWDVLLLQGGSSLQFGLIPMAFLAPDASADYICSGYWSQRSLLDPPLFGSMRLAWDGRRDGSFRRLPKGDELNLDPEAAYLHYVSNETVEGLQFQTIPGLASVMRICDMSSDFLSQPINDDAHELIYAHAQKNLGPAGLTIVLMRHRLLDRIRRPLPAMLDYRNHQKANSIYNTPPTFSIYATLLVLRWMENQVGDLEAMGRRNRRKAELIYGAIDGSHGFYQGWADPADRSLMNVSFTLADSSLLPAFLQEAAGWGLTGLNGHRSIGGLRASLYNAVEETACDILRTFLLDFQERHHRA